jgi:hypothetical protein
MEPVPVLTGVHVPEKSQTVQAFGLGSRPLAWDWRKIIIPEIKGR